MKKIIHGVLSDDGLLTANGLKKIKLDDLKTFSNVVEIGQRFNLNQIWILNGSKIFNRLALHHRIFLDENQPIKCAQSEIRNVCSARFQKFQVIFAGALEIKGDNNLARENLIIQWSLFEIKNAERLFNAVAWLYEKLDVLPSVPIRTGKVLAERSANETLEPLNENTLIYHENEANNLIYCEPFKIAGKKNIFGFDKNSMYLVASRSYSFGLGDSVKQTGGSFDKKLHGLWKIEINTKGLSPERIKYINFIKSDNDFLWTSDIEIIQELGAKIKVIEANIWKYNKRIFEKFSKILSSVRDEAKLLGLQIEEKAIKAIYTRFIGWMNREPIGREEIFYRPDWRSAIISLARANLIRNIFKIRDFADIEIVAVHIDEIVIATNLEFNQLPFPLVPDEKGNCPFKSTYQYEVSEVKHLIEGEESASELVTKLKKFRHDRVSKVLNDTKLSNIKRDYGR